MLQAPRELEANSLNCYVFDSNTQALAVPEGFDFVDSARSALASARISPKLSPTSLRPDFMPEKSPEVLEPTTMPSFSPCLVIPLPAPEIAFVNLLSRPATEAATGVRATKPAPKAKATKYSSSNIWKNEFSNPILGRDQFSVKPIIDRTDA